MAALALALGMGGRLPGAALAAAGLAAPAGAPALLISNATRAAVVLSGTNKICRQQRGWCGGAAGLRRCNRGARKTRGAQTLLAVRLLLRSRSDKRPAVTVVQAFHRVFTSFGWRCVPPKRSPNGREAHHAQVHRLGWGRGRVWWVVDLKKHNGVVCRVCVLHSSHTSGEPPHGWTFLCVVRLRNDPRLE